MEIAILAIILAIVAVLTGWLAPLAAGGRRPYGIGGDIAACVVVMLVLGIIEYQWIMPIFDFAEWVDWLAAIGDPWVLALIVLWLMRRVGTQVPLDDGAQAEIAEAEQAE